MYEAFNLRLDKSIGCYVLIINANLIICRNAAADGQAAVTEIRAIFNSWTSHGSVAHRPEASRRNPPATFGNQSHSRYTPSLCFILVLVSPLLVLPILLLQVFQHQDAPRSLNIIIIRTWVRIVMWVRYGS